MKTYCDFVKSNADKNALLSAFENSIYDNSY